MADVNSNININIDSGNSIAELKRLQSELSAFYTSMAKGGAAAAASASNLQNNLINSVNASGQFTASMKRISTTTESFTTALEKNKLSMGQYFKYSMGSFQAFSKVFSSEFSTIEKVARERVKTLQTQYIQLGRDATGAMKAIAIRPQVLDMNDLGTKTAMAAQKMQILNQLVSQGSTNLLNFGKNTQWAGRQLMVGFSIPLGIAGAAAAKEFMKLEEQSIRFKRVYGDTFTPTSEADAMVNQIKDLANAYTAYGISVDKTMGLAADAAAMGKQGADLLAQVNEASRLSVLGGVDQQKALETTTSLTNAFGIATKDLAKEINFLNGVENQTVTSIDDLTTAIPTAAPVIQQLGGNVQDLAFFLTAMREGGIDASEGANALKSGLASIINPTTEATNMLASFGINLQGIVDKDKGNVKNLVIDLANALNQLDPTNRAQAIEQMFGKFQFARISTLFQNVTKEGSQASRVLDLTARSTTELAILSQREMQKISDSPMYKFQGAVEKFQASLAPLGEAFLKAVTPIVEFGTKLLEQFNKWDEGTKNIAIIIAGAIGGIAPILLMSFGLVANGVANLIKFFSGLTRIFMGVGRDSNILGNQLGYMTQQQLEAAAVAASLDQSHNNLIQTFTSEAGAVHNLALAYERAAAAASRIAIGGVSRGAAGKKMATGGIISGPGGPKSDSVPAMLSNGEAVIPAEVVKKYPGLVNGLIAGNVGHHADGNMQFAHIGPGVNETASQALAQSGSRNYTGKALKAIETLVRLKVEGEVVRLQHAWGMSMSGSVNANLAKPKGADITQVGSQFAGKKEGVAGRWQESLKLSGQEASQRLLQELNNYEKAMSAKIRDLKNRGIQRIVDTDKQLEQIPKEQRKLYASLESLDRQVIQEIGAENKKLVEARKKGLGTIRDVRVDVASGSAADKKIRADKNASALFIRRRSSQSDGTRAGVSVQSGSAGGMGAMPAQTRTVSEVTGGKESQTRARKISEADARASMTPAQKRKYTMADEAGKKALLAAQRKQIRAAEEEATIAQRQAAAAKRSEAARKGVETRRLNAERKAAEAAEAEARGRQKPSFGSRIRGMGQRGGGMAGMALSGAMMMGSMAGGPAGDAMGAIAGPLMGVASMMSMIPGPAGLVVGALAGVGMAALAVNQAMNDARDKALAFGNAMGAGTANMEKLASFTGQVTDSQVKAKERLDIMTQGKAANGAADSVGGQFLASDTGKALTDSIAASIKNVDMATIKEQIYQQMATAVTTGAMDTATAKSIVDALGQKLKDPAFAVTINAKLSDLLGPNGEKLEGDKLNVVAELSKQSVTSVQGQISQLTSTLPDAGLNWARISEVAGLTVSTGVQAIEQQKQLLDSLDVEYEKRMANAKATGASASEQQKITDEYKKSRDENIKAQNETLNPVADPYAAAVGINLKTGNLLRTSNSIAAGEMGKAMDTQIENKYKDDAIQLELAKQARDKIVGSEGNNPGAMTKQEQAQAQVREYKLKAVLAEGDIPPQAFLDLLKGTEGNEAAASKQNQFVVDIIGKVGNADGAMMVQMASAMNEPQKLAFEATLTGDPEKVKQMTDMYQEIYKSGGQEAVNLVANLEVKSQGQGADAQQATTRLAKLKQGFKDIAELTANGPITMETLIKTNGDFEGLKDQAEYFNSLPAAQQKVFVERYLTVYDTVSPAEATAWMRDQTGQTTGTMLARDNAGRGQTFTQEEAMQAYAANSAREFTNAIGGASGLNEDNNNSDGGGGGGGGTPAKTIEDVISAQQKLITQTNDQKQAIQSLVSSGLSLADAYKVASNAEDAALIAHGANTEQIQRLTEATKEAEKATKSFAAAQNLAQSVQENIDKKALALKLAADSTLTNTQKQAIVDNKDLANLYMNPTFDPTTLQKALDDAANARSYELQIKKLTISGMQDIWKQGFDKASQAFSAQQNVIEIKFKAAKSPFENIVKAGQRAIEDIQNRPGGLDDLDADLQRISDKEQDINKAYDDKVKALEQVSKVNDKIIAQQKSQLTLADALTQGDIAAAAKAAQDMRAQDVSSGMQSQREMLDQSRKNEIDSLTGNSGMTRDQIEEKVRDLKAEVLAIEENSIEPAQRRIALLDRQMQDQIDTLTVLGKTKEKWDAINASLELANTKTKEFQDAMREALNIASTLGTALTTGVVPTVGGLTTPTTPTAPTAPARAEYVYPGEATWGSGSDVVKKLQTALNKGGAGLTVDGVFGPLTAAALKNFQSSNGLVADADAGPLTWRKLYDVGYYAKGGMVPYMASGGMAKMLAKGTDTIPAMLSAGEFVMKKSAVDQIGASKLAQMNDGKYQHQEASNSVYNINVQAQTDASPEDIARVVMQKMASVDRYRTTGNRF